MSKLILMRLQTQQRGRVLTAHADHMEDHDWPAFIFWAFSASSIRHGDMRGLLVAFLRSMHHQLALDLASGRTWEVQGWLLLVVDVSGKGILPSTTRMVIRDSISHDTSCLAQKSIGSGLEPEARSERH